MPEKFLFKLSESIRNIRLLPEESGLYLLSLTLNYFLVIIVFIICINLNYLNRVTAVNTFPQIVNSLLIPIFNNFDILRFLLFFLIILFLISIMYINRKFIKIYLNFNHSEIELIKKLKGNLSFVTIPTLLTCFSINLTALILILSYIRFFYHYIIKIIAKYNFSFTLLDFDYFDTSLFIFLFIISSTVLIFTLYYQFWDFGKQ